MARTWVTGSQVPPVRSTRATAVACRPQRGPQSDQNRLLVRGRRGHSFIQYPPSVREVGDALGVRSPNAVLHHLRALKRKGHLDRAERAGGRTGRARSITVAGSVCRCSGWWPPGRRSRRSKRTSGWTSRGSSVGSVSTRCGPRATWPPTTSPTATTWYSGAGRAGQRPDGGRGGGRGGRAVRLPAPAGRGPPPAPIPGRAAGRRPAGRRRRPGAGSAGRGAAQGVTAGGEGEHRGAIAGRVRGHGQLLRLGRGCPPPVAGRDARRGPRQSGGVRHRPVAGDEE